MEFFDTSWIAVRYYPDSYRRYPSICKYRRHLYYARILERNSTSRIPSFAQPFYIITPLFERVGFLCPGSESPFTLDVAVATSRFRAPALAVSTAVATSLRASIPTPYIISKEQKCHIGTSVLCMCSGWDSNPQVLADG